MPADNPTEKEKEGLQQLYLACRGLYAIEGTTMISVQKSFEEMLSGYLGKNAWRPTHASWHAALELTMGSVKNVQRAHGVIHGRLERRPRTLQILSSPEQSFDEWWDFYKKHDVTVMITKSEHNSNTTYVEDQLIKLPTWDQGMFESAGFNLRIRKSVEINWMKRRLEEKNGSL
jgi:hypothetical protein